MGIPFQTIFFVLLAAIGTLATEETSLEVDNIQQSTSNGFGYEIVQTKLEMLEFRFSELFVQLKEQGEAFLNNQRRMEDEQHQLNQIVERHERKIGNLISDLEDSVGINVTRISDQSRKILELQTICSNHDTIRSQLFEMHPKNKSARSGKLISVKSTDPEACAENTSQMSGLCRMRIGTEDAVVYREQVRFGGNWVVVLQRYDGSVPFNRSWAEYRDGFGTVGQEFWIGLERLHLLTVNSTHELAVEMEDFEGNYRYARYDKFSVGSEDEEYPLSVLGEYKGTAGDSLREHVGIKFQVNDSMKCSQSFGNGGGWFISKSNCFDMNIMGKWQNTKTYAAIIWRKFTTNVQQPLKLIKMMVRKSRNGRGSSKSFQVPFTS